MKALRSLHFVLAAVTAVALVSCKSSTDSNPTSTYSIVTPSTASPHGHTWGEWSAMWWNWALSMPTTGNPVAGTAAAEMGQTGSVWFLAGNNHSDTATRNITVPSGTALLVPLLNIYADTVGGYPPLDSLTILANPPQAFRDTWVQTAEVDGKSVSGLQNNWVAPTLFTSHLVANNLMGEPAGTYAGCSAGTYFMIDNLSSGSHTVHFHASMGADFTLDMTYHVTVQ
jgi:hypothetical protein